jgi:hypothetical protein
VRSVTRMRTEELTSLERDARAPMTARRRKFVPGLGLARRAAVAFVVQSFLGCSSMLPGGEPVARRAESLSWSGSPIEIAPPSDPLFSNAQFGASVAVSDNDLLIGAPNQTFGSELAPVVSGAAYFVPRSGSGWDNSKMVQVARGNGGDLFGHATAISGNIAVVGAPGGSSEPGAAYVYEKTGTGWEYVTALVSGTEGSAGDLFGSSVAVSGDTIVVSAINDDDTSVDAGAVYVFEKSGSSWEQQDKLVRPIGADSEHDHIGYSLAIDGDTIVAGAYHSVNGLAYVWVRQNGIWSWQAGFDFDKAVASNPISLNRYAGFGMAVALSGNIAAVGSPTYPDSSSTSSPCVSIFVRNGTSWSPATPSKGTLCGTAGSNFGAALALSSGRLVVGASQDNAQKGAASIYSGGGATWSLERELAPSDLVVVSSGGFGSSVALFGDSVIVGVPAFNSTHPNGYVYGFVGGCTQDSDCPDTRFCDGDGECKTKKQAGDTCNLGAGGDCKQPGCAVCATGLGGCVDGVCCDVKCDGACQACSIATGAVSDGACATFAPDEGAGVCSDGLTCSGSSSECVHCQNDSDCPAAKYCSADGTCEDQKQRGDRCDSSAGADCSTSGCRVCPGSDTSDDHCVDGFCCDTPMNHCGACSACAAKMTGRPNGICSPVPGGTDPHDACPTDDPPSCDADGFCDGAGACRPRTPAGVPCGDDTTCKDGAVSGKLCDGYGSCMPSTAPCAPFVCAEAACTTTCAQDADCASHAFCDDAGVCETVRADATACTRDEECDSTHCVDGVCCETTCDGQCEACAEEGKEGVCAIVSGDPRNGRPACDGTGMCAGTCDTSSRVACGYPLPAMTCDPKCTDGTETVGHCDGRGACMAGEPSSCGSYACDSDTSSCFTSCSHDGDSDCANGFRCEGTTCVPMSGGTCSADLSRSIRTDGTKVPCTPYICDRSSGVCKVQCTSVDDCADDRYCDQNHACVPEPASTAVSGCGCRAAKNLPRDRATSFLLAGVCLTLLGLRCRRAPGDNLALRIDRVQP